jgi:lycopene beta-cyclase
MTAEQRAWTADLYEYRWPGYAVEFPELKRRMGTGYASATSERLDAALTAALPEGARLTGVKAVSVEPTRVTLADQRVLTAGAVIDARGQRRTEHLDLGWQKFVGLEVETETPHRLAEPIIMDATVSQMDGYRFVYTLPLSADRLLIEDTYFSDGAEMGDEALKARILDYAAARGWTVKRVLREERGILPMAMGGNIGKLLAEAENGTPRIGLAAALFHPATGYSFSDAVRTADMIATLPDLRPATLADALDRHARATWRQRGFYRMLNVLLFRAARPDERYRVIRRFYKLDADLVARFYAGRSTAYDKLRTLIGKPPIPIPRAIRALANEWRKSWRR